MIELVVLRCVRLCFVHDYFVDENLPEEEVGDFHVDHNGKRKVGESVH